MKYGSAVHHKGMQTSHMGTGTEGIMLIILCIVLFRISSSFLHYAPNSMHYSQDYSQNHCQNNPVTLEMMHCMATLLN